MDCDDCVLRAREGEEGKKGDKPGAVSAGRALTVLSCQLCLLQPEVHGKWAKLCTPAAGVHTVHLPVSACPLWSSCCVRLSVLHAVCLWPCRPWSPSCCPHLALPHQQATVRHALRAGRQTSSRVCQVRQLNRGGEGGGTHTQREERTSTLIHTHWSASAV